MNNRNDRQILWRCFLYLRPYWKLEVGIYGLMILINLSNILVPQLIRWAIDGGIYGGDLQLLGQAVGGLLLLTLFKGVMIHFQGAWPETTSQSVAYDLRNELADKTCAILSM